MPARLACAQTILLNLEKAPNAGTDHLFENGAAGCGLIIDTSDQDALEDQIAFFGTNSHGLQVAVNQLKNEKVAYGDILNAGIDAQGLKVVWFDVQSLKKKSLSVAFNGEAWEASKPLEE